MPWEITGGSVTVNADGSSTVTVERENEDGDVQTSETTKDANGNVTHEMTSTKRANGDVDVEEERVEAGPPPRRIRRTSRTRVRRGRTTTEVIETVNGTRTRRYRSTTFTQGPHKGATFSETTEYDENGNPVRVTRVHLRANGDTDFIHTDDYSRGISPRILRDLPGYAVLPQSASAGAAFGGFVSTLPDEQPYQVVVRDTSGKCFETILDRWGYFIVPPGFTSKGKCEIEVLDDEGIGRLTETVKIGGSPGAKTKLRKVRPYRRAPELLRAVGHRLVSPSNRSPLPAPSFFPSVVVRPNGQRIGATARALAFSDREVVFQAPTRDSVIQVYVGDGVLSNKREVEGISIK